jgi:hypothetical protein
LQRPGDSRWSLHFKLICSLIKMYGATCSVLENIVLDRSTYSQRGDAAFCILINWIYFYRFVCFDYAWIFLCFVLAEPPKLSIFSHVYLTITRSNIQLDTIFLAKLSSLKSVCPTLIQCKFSFLGTSNLIFMLDMLLYTNFF